MNVKLTEKLIALKLRAGNNWKSISEFLALINMMMIRKKFPEVPGVPGGPCGTSSSANNVLFRSGWVENTYSGLFGITEH